MTRKIAMTVFCAVFGLTATAMAAPVVNSLEGLSAYGTWIEQGSNGRVTKTGTLTSADFQLAEGFSAQYYVTENKTVAKTGGNRVIPAGAIASVFDETESAKKADPAPKITEYTAEKLATSTDVIAAFGGKVGSDGQVISPIPANVKLTVNTTWDHVDFWGGKKTAGQSYTSGTVAETATWWPVAKKAEPAPKEITEIAADQLITADDVIAVFGNGTINKNGGVEVTVPAYTRFTVHAAWAAVDRWDSSTALPGDVVETAADALPVTFWPDPDYWTAQNTVAVTAAEIEKVFEIGEPLVEGSVWTTVSSAKAEMAGKILSLDEGLTAVTIKADGIVLETPVITVPAADAKTAADDADDVIRICKKADLEAADYTTLNGIRKASPVTVEVEEKGEGSNAVKFYVALASWKPALGGNFFDLSVDPTHVEVKDGVYTSKDGYAIAFVTAWLKNVADADRKAADTGNGGGGGGGGCDAGFGALAFALLPLFYFKKGRK